MNVSVPNGKKKAYFIRVFLTDSGHYLLPIGKFGQANVEEDMLKDAVRNYCRNIFGHQAPEDKASIQLHGQASRTGSSTKPTRSSSAPTKVQDINVQWTPTCDWPSFSRFTKHHDLDFFEADRLSQPFRYSRPLAATPAGSFKVIGSRVSCDAGRCIHLH